MDKALNVHIQNTESSRFPENDGHAYLEKWRANHTPVLIALTPYQRGQWKDLEDEIGEVISRDGSGLLLEGLLHICSHRNHTIRDPHHADICSSWFQRS